MHVDLLRVRLDEAIHAVVPLELLGVDESPGVKEGGVLEQITRELNVEALPTAIPESIVHEVGEMQIGETILLDALATPEGVTLLDDLEETVIATLSPPRLQSETADEIEAETEVVGEDGAQADAEGAASETLLRRYENLIKASDVFNDVATLRQQLVILGTPKTVREWRFYAYENDGFVLMLPN